MLSLASCGVHWLLFVVDTRCQERVGEEEIHRHEHHHKVNKEQETKHTEGAVMSLSTLDVMTPLSSVHSKTCFFPDV